MSKVRTFQAHIYSIKKLPQELRAEFKLDAYPFSISEIGPLPDVLEAYFKKYGIVHYRDEIRKYGILCQPDDDDETLIYERSGFLAYRSHVVLIYKGMSPSQWNPAGDPAKYRKIVKRHGDDYAWMIWNERVVIQTISETAVQLG